MLLSKIIETEDFGKFKEGPIHYSEEDPLNELSWTDAEAGKKCMDMKTAIPAKTDSRAPNCDIKRIVMKCCSTSPYRRICRRG